jgi:ABC-2 type transport system permease protein
VLYRRRALETAGDFMSVRWLRPVFLLTYTLSAGAFLAMFGSVFNDVYLIFLIIGIICGFFTGYMLLDRTIRVFRKGRILQLVILLAAIALSVWSVKIDLFGIVRWVPEADRVESIQVDHGDDLLLITDPEEMDIILSAHRSFVDGNDQASGQYVNIRLRYTLQSGREVTRKYAVLSTDPNLVAMKKKIFSSPEAVFNLTGSWEDFKEGVYSISYEDKYGKVTEFRANEQLDQLLEALYADCEAGTLAQGWAFHSDAATRTVEQLVIRSDPEVSGSSSKTLYITIYGDAKNVKAVLSALLAAK